MAGFNITIAGDSAINLEFAKTISPQTSGMIRVAAQTLTDDPIPGVTELVPTFCSLMVTYDPCVIGYDELCQRVQGKLRNLAAAETGVKRIVVIPVCYGGEFGPDLPTVAHHAGMSEQDVISLHCAHDYLIDMLGFLPGFAYLGGLDPRLHTPRLSVPRTEIPAGSVASAARRRASTRWQAPEAGRSSAAAPCARTTPSAPSPSCTAQASTFASSPSRRSSMTPSRRRSPQAAMSATLS